MLGTALGYFITDGQALGLMFRRLPLTGIHPHGAGDRPADQDSRAAGPFWPAHEPLFHRKVLKIPTCWATLTGSGRTVDAWSVDLADCGCGSGSRSTPTAPKKAAPAAPPTPSSNGRRHLGGDDQATLDAAFPPRSRSDDDDGLYPPNQLISPSSLRPGGLTCD
jgi:hypothetical protein